MQQMEADLGTKLDWMAVDHYNTGHPHSQILVRGVTEDGKTSTSPATISPMAIASAPAKS
jgi:type IV secretory pathway VirD2 relaxase